jgi:sugar lactone lactonase YvrE
MEYRAIRSVGGKGTAPDRFSESLRGIAVDAGNNLYAVGDKAVKVFDAEGEFLRAWSLSLPGFSIAVGADGRVWVGQWQQVEIYDPQGARVDTWRGPAGLGLVTAIGFVDEDVLFADATARWIRRYGKGGELLNNIGDRHRKGGFHIPNGVVDFAVDDAGQLHVPNPGLHRVERYAKDGELLGRFGHFDGQDPVGFPGCCNPTNLALDPEGRIVVSEKAGPRVKLYSPDGQLLAVIADDGFDPGAKNMDLAVDSRGQIYVADTERFEIRVFVPAVREATP